MGEAVGEIIVNSEQRQEVSQPNETPHSESFKKLRSILVARLRKISQPETSEPTSAAQESEPKKAQETTIYTNALLKILANPRLSELNGAFFDIKVRSENQTAQDLKKVRIEIINGRINISGYVDDEGKIIPLPEGTTVEGIPNESEDPTKLTELFVRTIFSNATPQEHQALTSAIIGKEDRTQIETLAHYVGYITRDDLAKILGIPTNPEERKKFLEKPENKRYQKLAEKIYGTGEPGSTAIPELPDAQNIIEVLKTAGINPQDNLKEITKKIKNHFGENAEAHPIMQLISGLESQIKENKKLAEIISNHYSAIESGAIPKDNLQELLTAIKNLYDVNGNINEKKAKELKEKIINITGTTGMGILILLIMLWQGIKESR